MGIGVDASDMTFQTPWCSEKLTLVVPAFAGMFLTCIEDFRSGCAIHRSTE